jgi:uncharacterized membrane protein
METTGFDLGIFEQAVRAYSHFTAPVAQLKGPGYNLLGDHFHPILATLAPLYRLFPSPITLLLAQAALLACSAIPVTRLAIHHAGPSAGAAVGVAYGMSWGLLNAIAFDFHEICFAVPMAAFSLERLVRREWRAAVLFAVPMMLVKEDLALTVAAIGGYLLLQRQYRLGGATIVFSVVAGLLIVLVVIPAFNASGNYAYLGSVEGGVQNPLVRLFTPETKLHTVLMLLAPTVFLAVRSPLVLITVPTLAWRFWSTNETYWRTAHHYSAILVPITFVAFVDALRRSQADRPPLRRHGCRLAVAASLAVTLVISTSLPLFARSPPWLSAGQTRAARESFRLIPDGSTVAASNHLAPQLTRRTTVYLFPQYPARQLRPEWVIVSAAENFPVSPAEYARLLAALPNQGYTVVYRQDGVILFRR